MDVINENIIVFFEKVLKNIDCEDDTKSYIISIYDKYRNSVFDLSKDSITLTFIKARQNNNFSDYQNIGDWIFWASTIAPQHLKNATREYYIYVAKNCYNQCYLIVNKKWKLFLELSEKFEVLEESVRNQLSQKYIIF